MRAPTSSYLLPAALTPTAETLMNILNEASNVDIRYMGKHE